MNKATQPVDRSRRYKFVSRVVTFSLIAAVTLTVLGGIGVLTSAGIVTTVATGLLTGGFAIAGTYIGGSVIDYTFGNGGSRSPNQGYGDRG